MRTSIAVILLWGVAGALAIGQPPALPGPSVAKVVVNSQKSLADAVGTGFIDEAWAYPTGLLPSEFPGLKYVSGPSDAGLSKGAWRKPIVLKDTASDVELLVNCYRRQDAATRESATAKTGAAATPFVSLSETDYQYHPTTFHDLRAAAATEADRTVFVFHDGDLLFKIEAIGDKSESRRDATAAVGESIWKFRQVK